MLTSTLFLALVATAHTEAAPYAPTTADIAAAMQRSASLGRESQRLTYNLRLQPNWIGNTHVWFRRDTGLETGEYMIVEIASGRMTRLFDHADLAKKASDATGTSYNADNLVLANLSVADDRSSVSFEHRGTWYRYTLGDKTLTQTEANRGGNAARPTNPRGPNRPETPFPTRVHEGYIQVHTDGEWANVSPTDGFTFADWSPDNASFIGYKLIPGDRRQVSTLRTNTPDATRSTLKTVFYDQPGDKLDTTEYYYFPANDPTKPVKLNIGEVINGGHPWSSSPRIFWWRAQNGDPIGILQITERGYQQVRIVAIDPRDGSQRDLIVEHSDTFVDTGDLQFQYLVDDSGRRTIVWLSERDDWSHIYKLDVETGDISQLTGGEFVVRTITHIDEANGHIYFMANGEVDGDPYHQHLYRVGMDGKGMRRLTAPGRNHSISWSPDRSSFISTASTADQPPVFELRRNDGTFIATLAKGDDSAWLREIKRRPEVFSAKGRDGKTDIWGLVNYPSTMERGKTYPVIEMIYAGPHDSHVPKTYSAYSGAQSMAELGFIVVQIDGMGTDNRGKVFHDVAWQNIADAGFPDRIAWMKALAERRPELDLSRVGIMGTSAGGQNSAGALLFHPEFYKVAVSSCGCHDNRMDKFWWNEQWMGYPVGDHYEKQSNITNASKLQGQLMLIVGEVDGNVPPESTFRFADALIQANKDFELVVIPGADHTSGGPYGERKRRDFFIRHLHGVEPPRW